MRQLIWAAGLAAGMALAACGGDGGGAAGSADGSLKPQDRVMGDPDAPVTVIEYASITCTVCKRWHDDVWPQFKTELVDTGQVRFVFRELPTGPQEVAMAGFLLARCAPENRYFNVLGALFDRQQRLVSPATSRSELLAVARAAGLSEDRFNACIRDEAEIARINDWVTEADELYGITSTPSFLINGEVHVGFTPIETFRDAVADAAASGASETAEGE